MTAGGLGADARVNLLWRPHGTVEDFVDTVLARVAFVLTLVFVTAPDNLVTRVGVHVYGRLLLVASGFVALTNTSSSRSGKSSESDSGSWRSSYSFWDDMDSERKMFVQGSVRAAWAACVLALLYRLVAVWLLGGV